MAVFQELQPTNIVPRLKLADTWFDGMLRLFWVYVYSGIIRNFGKLYLLEKQIVEMYR